MELSAGVGGEAAVSLEFVELMSVVFVEFTVEVELSESGVVLLISALVSFVELLFVLFISGIGGSSS